jgi:glycosyltransferase involved in cell wall biosynthesis
VKVVISTPGRFHLFALARELERRGALERIYSGFAWSALAREDVARERVTTFPWFRTPYMALNRLPGSPRGLSRWLEAMSCVAQDSYVAVRLPDCDVFIGHDGAGLASGREAKRRGARYVADTGTTHMGYRRVLLNAECAAHGVARAVDNEAIHRRQLEEYAEADAIVVPSSFVKTSFIDQGFAEERLRVIPYGVRTEYFSPVGRPPDDVFRILFVGALSIRKGARYLLQAFREFDHPRKELTIVGTVQAEARPFLAAASDLKINLVGPIPNIALKRFYSESHVFVLPSVEEGLGMVMAEALACGCPIVATFNTGAEDLFTHGREGFIVPARDARAISQCLTRLADEPALRARMSAAALARVRALGGWSAYGEIYAGMLRGLTDGDGRNVTMHGRTRRRESALL